MRLYPQTLGLLLGWLCGSLTAATIGILPALLIWIVVASAALIAAR